MNYIVSAVMIIAAFGLNNWYGLQRGKKNPSMARNVHGNDLINFLFSVTCLALLVGGIYIAIKD